MSPGGRIAQPLPVPSGQYNDIDETVTRRQIEQNFEDLYNVIEELKDDIEALEALSGDFYFDVASGAVANHQGVNKFGQNLDIDTTTDPEDVWDGGAVWAAPTEARVHDIVSASTDDAAAGTGAQTIRVYGLTSWDNAETFEDITMNGTTNVPTSNSWVILHRMKVLTSGSGNANAGDITATAQTDSTVTAQITAGKNQTLMAIYGIPSTQTLYLHKWYMDMNRTAGTAGSAECELLVNESPDVNLDLFLVNHHVGLSATGSSHVTHEFYPPLPISGPAVVKVSVEEVSGNDTDISAGFDGVVATETPSS